MKDNILVIIPAYNEEFNIRRTVESIFSCGILADILVIDDGSIDNTVEEAKKTRAFVVSLPFNLGIGGAVQMGFIFARRRGYDIAVQFDGDGQHDSSYIDKLISPILNGEADMVIGSRFLPPYSEYRSSFFRRIGIHFFSWLISLLTDCNVTDPTSGFRAYSRNVINLFSEYYPNDFPEPEAIMVARRYKVRIKEVPVEMHRRAAGNSSIRYMRTLYYMIKVTFAILLDKLKNRRIFMP